MTAEEIAEENFLQDLLSRRRLEDDGYVEDPYSDGANQIPCTLDGSPTGNNFCCTNCNQETMKFCKVLGGKLIEDKYGRLKAGANAANGDDSCSNLEVRAERLDVFGRTKTFRDTSECRRMVYDYTCLWWGSDNDVYTNNCRESDVQIDGKPVTAAYQPCLSYCTQVANMCANRPEWIKLCKSVVCQGGREGSSEEAALIKCTPGPSEAVGASAATDCNEYDVVSFYSAGFRIGRWSWSVVGASVVAAVTAVVVIV